MALPASSITVNDGATTPVAQTFSIADRTGLVSAYRNTVAALIRGMQIFKHEARLGKSNGAANRVLMSLVCPIEGLVSGQTTVIKTSSFKVECNFSPDASLDERKTAFGLLVNMLAHADVKDATTKLVSLG